MSHKKKKKKRHIRVFAPLKPVIHPEEEEVRRRDRRLEEERLKVLRFSRKARKPFGVFAMVVGAFVFGFFTYFLCTNIVLEATIPEIKILLIGLFLFLGVVNVVAGLLLIGE